MTLFALLTIVASTWFWGLNAIERGIIKEKIRNYFNK
jgi:hypothetical protein